MPSAQGYVLTLKGRKKVESINVEEEKSNFLEKEILKINLVVNKTNFCHY